MACNFIVSNTVSVFGRNASIIHHDMNKRHGKYCYEYPMSSFFPIGISMGGMATATARSKISLVAVSSLRVLVGLGGTADGTAYSRISA